MKKLFITAIAISLSTSYAFSQKAKVQTAYNFWKEPYQQYDKAKAAIDEAAVHEQTIGMAKTWYYRGLIYSALYNDPKYGSLCDNCLLTAYESFKKANELDPKNEWRIEIELERLPKTFSLQFNEGVKHFEEKDFNGSLAAFEVAMQMDPADTSSILNAALAADQAGNKDKAMTYYNKLISMQVNDPNLYGKLSERYRQEKNYDKALEIARAGRQRFPNDLNLMLSEINVLLTAGRNAEATSSLETAIQKDPKNANLYLALGSTYDNLANPKSADGKDLPKPANYNDLMTKAEKAYKDGLVASGGSYEMNYNLGAMYFNQAADMANAANDIKSDADYQKAKVAFETRFKLAQPYLEKALELNPRKTEEDQQLYDGALISLKQLYIRIGDMENYNKIKTMLEKK
jgi:tetratricopeptide (TPR) repeat protein